LVSEKSSDLDLALKVSRGDEQALKIFYNKYADLLFVYIKHLLKNVPLANIEDIWQETLLSAIKGLAGFHGCCRLFTSKEIQSNCLVSCKDTIKFCRAFPQRNNYFM
jgi:hypothetical protein